MNFKKIICFMLCLSVLIGAFCLSASADESSTGDTCSHPLINIWLEYKSTSKSTHSHRETCMLCDELLVNTVERCVFRGGYCVCGNEVCTHSSTFTYYIPDSSSTHKLKVVCNDCSALISFSTVGDCQFENGVCIACEQSDSSCSHQFEKFDVFVEDPLKCSNCDFVCEHVSSYIQYDRYNLGNQHVRKMFCSMCDNMTDMVIVEDCSFSDGVCVLCGFSEDDLCSHSDSYVNIRPMDGYDSKHCQYVLCSECDFVLDTIWGINCSFENNGVCECGNRCPHVLTSDLSYTIQTEFTHFFSIECLSCHYLIKSNAVECDFSNPTRTCDCGNHTCVFDQLIEDDQYMLQSATCSRYGLYYYSCVCGKKTTNISEYFSTMTYGKHMYVEGVCVYCGETPGSLVLRNGWLLDNSLGNYNTVLPGDGRSVLFTTNNSDYVIVWGCYGGAYTRNYTSSDNTGDILVIKYKNAVNSPDTDENHIGSFLLFSASVGNANGTGNACGGGIDDIWVPFETSEEWNYIVLDMSELCPGSWQREGTIYSLDYLRIQNVSMEIAYIALYEEENESAIFDIDPDFKSFIYPPEETEDATEDSTEESTQESTDGSDKPLIDISLDDIKVDFMPLLFPAALILVCVIVISSVRNSNRRRRR